MQQLKHKQKRDYAIIPRALMEKTNRSVDLAMLRKEVSRQWQGGSAVDEIRSQRKK